MRCALRSRIDDLKEAVGGTFSGFLWLDLFDAVAKFGGSKSRKLGMDFSHASHVK